MFYFVLSIVLAVLIGFKFSSILAGLIALGLMVYFEPKR